MPTQQKVPLSLALVLTAVAIAFLVATSYTMYNSLTAGSTDFYPTWKAAELFFKEGVSPYDARIGRESQAQIYDRPAEEGEDLFLFFYPFYAIFYFAPLIFFSYQLAAAIYMEVLFLGLLLALVMNLHLLGWLPPPMMLALMILFTVTGYFSARGILLAQHALLAYIGHMVALWGIYRKRDGLAGLGLALSTIKPQTGFLLVPLLLLWAWRMNRPRILWTFGAAFGLLCALSFVLEPDWVARWIDQVQAYEGSTETVPTAYIVTHFISGVPHSLENSAQLLLSLALLIPLGIFWKKTLFDGEQAPFLWGYCMTLTVTLLIAPRTATTYYVELYPILLASALLFVQRKRGMWVYIGGIALLIGYWALHILTVPPVEEGGAGKEAAIVYVVFPVLCFVLLFAYRGQWRLLNSPYERITNG